MSLNVDRLAAEALRQSASDLPPSTIHADSALFSRSAAANAGAERGPSRSAEDALVGLI